MVNTPITTPFELVIEGYASNEFVDGPHFAVVSLDQAFVNGLVRLRRLCQENNLEMVGITAFPQTWDREDKLHIRGDLLQVMKEGRFWFEAHPKHASYDVETRGMAIDDLMAAIAEGSEGAVPDECFAWSNGKLFYSVTGVEHLIEKLEES